MVIYQIFLSKDKFNFYKSRVAKMKISLNLAVVTFLSLLTFGNTARIFEEAPFIKIYFPCLVTKCFLLNNICSICLSFYILDNMCCAGI